MTATPPFMWALLGSLGIIAMVAVADTLSRWWARGDDVDRLLALKEHVDDLDSAVRETRIWLAEQFGPPAQEGPSTEPIQTAVGRAVDRVIEEADTSEVETGPATVVTGEWREVNIGGTVRRFYVGP